MVIVLRLAPETARIRKRNMLKETDIIQSFNWADLRDSAGYQAWRSVKLDMAENAGLVPPLQIDKLSQPTDSERAELRKRCKTANFALYKTSAPKGDSKTAESALREFAASMGLRLAESHRSAEQSGVVGR